MVQSFRFIGLALLSAAAVSFGVQRASAGLLDGGWGCGCGAGYGYVQAYVVAPVTYGYVPVGYGGWGWHHRPYYRHYGWRHHYY